MNQFLIPIFRKYLYRASTSQKSYRGSTPQKLYRYRASTSQKSYHASTRQKLYRANTSQKSYRASKKIIPCEQKKNEMIFIVVII